MHKCLVIDDEELARKLLITYISRLEFLDLVGEFENPIDAIPLLNKIQVDLIFLDIQMPEIKGTDFAKMISPHTKIIFTTAYSEYALEGFELNALDYLLKPITFKRFLTAINKLKSNTEPNYHEESITIKSGYDLHKIKFKEILYIESDSEYVTFYTENRKIMSLQTLKTLNETLPKSLFMRVHRSYIVNKSKISLLKGRDLIVSEKKIPVSATYYDAVKEQLF